MEGKTKRGQRYFRRLSVQRLVEHHINALAFTVLVVTGLSQRFHETGWATWVVETAGGIDNLRLIHRWVGVLFSLLLLQHFVVASVLVLFRRARASMIVAGRDFTDAIQNIRFYLGLSRQPARCDRYDYKQKFEYWGVLMGGVLMVVTGLLLWFPSEALAAFPFLPGQIVPAAKVAHSNEAMLAFLIIVIWHIYNAVFSPEVFPLDTVILHGKISEERMQHEHPLEYARWVAEGKVSEAQEESAESKSDGEPTP